MRRSSVAFWIGAIVFLAAILLMTQFIRNEYPFFAGYVILQFVVLAVAWSILGGYAGYVNFGTNAFFGVGVYTAVALAKAFDMPLGVQIAAAAVVGMLLGLGVGLLTLRMRGIFFSIATIALAIVIETTVTNWRFVGGAAGIQLQRPPVMAPFDSYVKMLFFVQALLAVVAIVTARYVQRSRIGRGLQALRDDELAAECAGVPTLRLKLLASAWSPALLDVGGPAYACRDVPAIRRPVVGLQSQLLGLGAGDGADRGNRALDRPGGRRDPARLDLQQPLPCRHHLLRSQRAGARHHAGAVRGRGAQRHHRPGRPALPLARGRQGMTSSAALEMPDAPLLRVDGITKTFGGFVALDNVSLDIRKGERFGLIGPNGSGKTTLINCISGAFRPQAGTVFFRGEDITQLPPHVRAHRGIARSFQIPRPFRSMTVVENLMVALDFSAVRDAFASAQLERDAAMSILTRMGLAAKADAATGTLSQVELRKMELARAMAVHPKLLISDEAMAGLSSSEVDEVLDLLISLGEEDITIIMIEHIMQAVMRFSQRMMCLDAGKIIAIGAPAEVMANQRVQEAYLGA